MQRRNFLKQSGLMAAGAFTLSQTDLLARPLAKTIDPFGVQLYSVRDVLPKDPKGIMTQLAQMGYKQFESYEGPQGFLWGMTPKDSKSFLNDLGVKMISTHFNFRKHFDEPGGLQKSIDMASEAGLSYLLCPYIGPQKSFDDWKKIADDFNKAGEQVRKAGLKFGYHNHDYSFKPLDGKLPQEYLLANTDPKNVMFELDLCWIDVAGVDTVAHLKKYGKRYELCHIKDYTKENGKPVQNDLGKGAVDFKKTLRTAMDSGIKYFIVEQEEYPQEVMISMKNDAEYMKKLTV
ncbi:sugar phosphate isomerase/epimerase family protein [Spirosoma sp. KUDC1026]|uniref:sugar phosphate isomerase/epimerase family protein n=1 Tax=Spirosoma sp. KUDC1026 TaxID=2745947 RepID=UPI00159BE4D7|nr:sugar phosphate isomerase/epimerase [Spirosoma sp. KUDC1026]QKZ13043.1 sugar phosphate isomerase/epimerase [Spirosoma sp. KUDC1026]